MSIIVVKNILNLEGYLFQPNTVEVQPFPNYKHSPNTDIAINAK